MKNLCLLFLLSLHQNISFAKSLDEVHLSARSYLETSGYVHSWHPFPTLTGTSLDGKKMELTVSETKVSVYIVTASWCIKCQNLTDYLKEISNKFSPINTDFVYVFAHDTAQDALGFVKYYGIKNKTILAGSDILKELHNPPLPTILIADRNGWLLTRFERTSREDLDKLQTLLQDLTVY